MAATDFLSSLLMERTEIAHWERTKQRARDLHEQARRVEGLASKPRTVPLDLVIRWAVLPREFYVGCGSDVGQDCYPTIEAAAEAIRVEQGWAEVHLSDVAYFDIIAIPTWTAYPTVEAARVAVVPPSNERTWIYER